MSEKTRFVNDIKQFWKKIHEEQNVKIANCFRALARVFRFSEAIHKSQNGSLE